jgi:hypothetical protein
MRLANLAAVPWAVLSIISCMENLPAPKLGELFRNGNPIPIDFGLCFRWRVNQSNLLLEQKIVEPKPN